MKIFVSLLLLTTTAYTQNLESNGPRSMGLGGTSTILKDDYSLFNNPGTLGFIESNRVATGIDNRFGIHELNTLFATISFGMPSVKSAVGISRFGDEVFNLTTVSAGLGHQLGIGGLGVSLDYQQLNISGFGRRDVFILNLGGNVRLGPKTDVGAVFKNINQAKVSKETDERFPVYFGAGVGLKVSNQVKLYSDVGKYMSQNPEVRFGVEYKPSESLRLRSGFSSAPVQLSFGVGVNFLRFEGDYGIRSHPVLGPSHSLSISWILKEK